MTTRLKEVRQLLNKTQQEIADEIGITRVSYSYYENGIRDIDAKTLVNMANRYNISTDFILGIEHGKTLEDDVSRLFPYLRKKDIKSICNIVFEIAGMIKE